MNININSPIKIITSGTVPTTDNMPLGSIAFGSIEGVDRWFANFNNEVKELTAQRLVAGDSVDLTDNQDGTITINAVDVGMSVEVEESLPAIGVNSVIYIIGTQSPYDVYIWIESSGVFKNIGTTDIDMNNYYTKSQVDNIVANASLLPSDNTIEIREGGIRINTPPCVGLVVGEN